MAENLSLHGSFKDFELHGVLNTQEVVRNGKYASTIELKFHGLKCAGTKINAAFYNEASPTEKMNIQKKLKHECKVLSNLRHPNIIQFIGVTHDTDNLLPMIVTEFLPATLNATLHKDSVLSDAFKYSILDDVATGLCYLHEHTPNPITHGSLTANNILLTSSMVAKISYLGDLSKLPLSKWFESPTAIDISSFGVLMTDMFREKHNTQPTNHPDSMLHLVSKEHPLRNLIEQCLNTGKNATLRASEVLDQVRKVRIHCNIPNDEELADWQQLVSTIHQLQLDKQAVIEEHRHTAGVSLINAAFKAEIESTELSELKAKNSYLEKEIAILMQDLQSKTITLEAKNKALAELAAQQNDLSITAQDMKRSLKIMEEKISLKDEVNDITEKKLNLYRNLAVTISNDMVSYVR